MRVPADVLELAHAACELTVLTGAGMSAESGLATFRDAQTGLWANQDPASLATPEAWEADPARVWAWYRWRMTLMTRAQPNAGHRALAEWSEVGDAHLWVVTQNVDDLHERAGSDVLAHLHGSIFALRCSRCGQDADAVGEPLTEPVERLDPPVCVHCGGLVRPGIVWFGEALPQDALERAEAATLSADLVLVIGTSGIVYPAAGLPIMAHHRGVPVVGINPEETDLSDIATATWRVPAGEALPALLTALRENTA